MWRAATEEQTVVLPMHREWMLVWTALGFKGRPCFRTETTLSFVTRLQENPETEGIRCSDFQFLLLGPQEALGNFFFLCHNTLPAHQLPAILTRQDRGMQEPQLCARVY